MSEVVTCTPCNQIFGSRKALLRHQRENSRHSNEQSDHERSVCTTCGKTFARPYDLKRHEKRRHGEEEMSDHGDPLSMPTVLAFQPRDTEQEQPLPAFFLAVPCGICQMRFAPGDHAKLIKHIDGHFEDLETSNLCDICQIGFMHKSDLDCHLRSAANGDCGFKFEHKSKCSGHHPPVTRNKHNKRERDNDERFDFCFRIRNWEQAQLRSHSVGLETTTELWKQCERGPRTNVAPSERYAPSLGARTEPPPGKQAMVTFTVDNGRTIAITEPCREGDATSAVLQAITTGNAEAVTAAVSLIPDITKVYYNGMNVLEYAIDQRRSDLCGLFIELGVPVDGTPGLSGTPLRRASRCSDLHSVKSLLSKGASPDLEDGYGFTALELAILRGSTETVRMLLDHGANPNHGAATKHESSLLADQGPCPNKESYLLTAARFEAIPIVALLLSRGAVIRRGSEGHELLNAAIRKLNCELLELFLTNGVLIDADVGTTDVWIGCSMACAVRQGAVKCLSILISHFSGVLSFEARENIEKNIAKFELWGSLWYDPNCSYPKDDVRMKVAAEMRTLISKIGHPSPMLP